MPSEASRRGSAAAGDRGASRDRDALGRPRNARPRDGLGRPLPRGSVAGVERVPDELAMPLHDAVALAQHYLDTDRPFHAHEVLEALWKSQPADERDLWQGLAQIAVGITHALRRNTKGAIELLNRGSERLRGYTGERHAIAVGEVLAQTQFFIEMVEAGDEPLPDRFRLHLR